MFNKYAYSVQMSFDVPDSDKRIAEKASELFQELSSLLNIADEHLDLIYEPFKHNEDIKTEELLEHRTIFRKYRDIIKENFNKILKKSYRCVLLMSSFSSDAQIVELMNSFISETKDIETQVNKLLSIFSDLSSIDFRINLIKAIDLIRLENNQLKQIINDRVLNYIDTNILAKNWVKSVIDENQNKIYENIPLIVELFKEREKALSS